MRRIIRLSLVAIGPAVVLTSVLYVTGVLGRLSDPPVASRTSALDPGGVKFSELLSNDGPAPAPVTTWAKLRSTSVAPFTPTAIEMVGDRLVVAGRGFVASIGADGRGAPTYLVPKDASYAAASLQAVRRLQADGTEKVWVFDYYGLASLYNTARNAAPIRVVNAGDSNVGAAWSGSRLFVHRPVSSTELVELELDGTVTDGAALVDGYCCKGLSVESTRLRQSLGTTPYGSLNKGIAWWLGRASVTSSEGVGIAAAFLADSRIHLRRPDGSLKIAVAGPRAQRLDFSTRAGEELGRIDFLPTGETRFAYTSATSNHRSVFALFAGGAFGVVGAGRAFWGRELHEYSWEGQLLGVHLLPELVTQISVNGEGTRVFGVSDTNVLEFSMVRPKVQ